MRACMHSTNILGRMVESRGWWNKVQASSEPQSPPLETGDNAPFAPFPSPTTPLGWLHILLFQSLPADPVLVLDPLLSLLHTLSPWTGCASGSLGCHPFSEAPHCSLPWAPDLPHLLVYPHLGPGGHPACPTPPPAPPISPHPPPAAQAKPSVSSSIPVSLTHTRPRLPQMLVHPPR